MKNRITLDPENITPPKAAKKETILTKHGDSRIDNYYWMQERDSPEVLAYLEEENAYNDRLTAHTKSFRQALFSEMKARIKEDDESVPYKINGYWYITRFVKGGDYPVYTRKKDSLDGEEEILLDGNELAKEYSFFHVKGINVSPDNRFMAFATDVIGRRIYTIKIKDLLTGKTMPLQVENTTGSSAWANDNATLFYAKRDLETLRSSAIFKCDIYHSADHEQQVYYENDDTFDTFVYKSKSKEYLIIGSTSTLTSEYRFTAADTPHATFKVFQPRQRGMEYGISHYEDHFYILTNADKAINFKLMRASVQTTGKAHWEEVIPHRKEVLIEDIEIFKDFLVVTERFQGLNRIRIKQWAGDDYYLPFDNETYTAYTSVNPDFDTVWLRYSYNALTTPASVIDFNMQTGEMIVRKEQEIPGGHFKKENYRSERVWATARDGSHIPISLVYREGTRNNGKAPLLQYGYGSYGVTLDPYFSIARLSLLDRGFIYAIAHVRGSEYMGRNWYEDGKLMKKKNTFTDFVDCSKYLIEKGYTSPEHLYAMGGSAGGLLMGAIMNMAPELYRGIVASVPFVDVITTMLDDSIPLTTGEYDEWGNPNEEAYYRYIKSYSPYDNVSPQKYPNILITTGYHDSQVQYWEPAKWVAKIRSLKKDNNLLLFHVNMNAGHSGASGRFEALKEVAEEYAFLLDLEGIKR